VTQSNGTGMSSELDVIMAVTELECSVLSQYGWPEGRDSAVSIVTHCGLDGPGIESRWGQDFLHPSKMAVEHTQLPVQWVPGLFRVKAAGAWH
jgi:hypothetical protein